jgi:hypothetical protein
MVVKNIESDFISEAYFVLKSGAEDEEGKISAEAERIIRECGSCKKKRRAVNTAFLFALVGMSAVALIIVAAIIISQLS